MNSSTIRTFCDLNELKRSKFKLIPQTNIGLLINSDSFKYSVFKDQGSAISLEQLEIVINKILKMYSGHLREKVLSLYDLFKDNSESKKLQFVLI